MSENMRIQSELHTDLEVYRLKGELLELREQNRVLREALQQVAKWDVRSQSQSVQSFAQAALTATSQPAPPYKEWCRHPEECAGLASCPRNPTCAD